MKKSLMLLMVGLMFAGSVGCSSAPKQDEGSDVAISAEDEAAMAEEEISTPEQAPSKSGSSSDLGLGAGSSGRGH